MRSIIKSVTINFVAVPTVGEPGALGSLAELIVGLDSIQNDEKTSFNYGEKAYFQAFSNPSNMTLTMTPTDGVVTSEGSGTLTIEDETVDFIDTNEGGVSKLVTGITSSTWLGTDLGSVSAVGSKITTSKKGFGVLKITYTSSFRRYGLVLPTKDEASYPVIVVVVGT